MSIQIIEALSLEFKLILLYLLLVLANMMTGIHCNINIHKIKFNKKKFYDGILKALVIVIGILLGTSAIACFPLILSDLNIEVPYIDEITTLSIFAILISGIGYYAKSFINNLRKIFKGNEIKDEEAL